MRKALDILPAAFRRRGFGIAASLALRAVLNLAGLAALLPVLALALDPARLDEGIAGRIGTAAGFASREAFAAAVCVAVVAIVVTKNLLIMGLARIERNYVYDLYRTLSRRLFIAYHDRGLSFVKASGTTALARNVNAVCLAFTAGVLRPAATIAAETMLLLLLAAALALYAPLAALLAAAILLPAGWLYQRLVRERINRYGELENRAQREKARLVAETFRGFADIEVNGAFPALLRAFDRAMERVVDTRRSESAIALLPQMLTETGLAAGLALLAAWGFGTDIAHKQLLFGVFAIAALRLMPSVRSILSAWASMRYNRYTIDILHEALRDAAETSRDDAPASDDRHPESLPFEREIALRDLSFRYADGACDILHDFSLTIRKGERIGIRGSSGAGKSTLVNLLTGLYEPTAGCIEIDGTPLTAANRRAWQRRIGYVSQRIFLTEGSLAENVAFGRTAEETDRRRVIEALDAARLREFVDSLPAGIDTPAGECGCRLSGGQRQRIGIARALYRNADLLIFDEATSELDPATEQEVARAIDRIAAARPGLTLLIVAHRERTLEGCDRIVTIGTAAPQHEPDTTNDDL